LYLPIENTADDGIDLGYLTQKCSGKCPKVFSILAVLLLVARWTGCRIKGSLGPRHCKWFDFSVQGGGDFLLLVGGAGCLKNTATIVARPTDRPH
jgi:hypothetical protein